MALEVLYLVRHSKAVDSHPKGDRHRPLSDEGRRRLEALVPRAAALGFRADLALSSPYVRAVQTRDLFEPVLADARRETSSSLTPDGDAADVLPELEAWEREGARRIALFTHNPFVTSLAEFLVVPGSVPGPQVDALAFDAPTVLALRFDHGLGRFQGRPEWILHP